MVTNRAKSEVIPEKWVWKEVPKEPKGYYELQGRYHFWNPRIDGYAIATGYSKVTKHKCRGKELETLREQAIDFARDKLVRASDAWVFEAIENEEWIELSKDVPIEYRGGYQLQGRYWFWNYRIREFATMTGYSKVTKHICQGEELQNLRKQAIDFVIDKLLIAPGEWFLVAIEHEVWLKW